MGIIVLYGAGIQDAIKRSANTEELEMLRDHGRAILKQQGDLRAALDQLEAEIDRRQGGAASY